MQTEDPIVALVQHILDDDEYDDNLLELEENFVPMEVIESIKLANSMFVHILLKNYIRLIRMESPGMSLNDAISELYEDNEAIGVILELVNQFQGWWLDHHMRIYSTSRPMTLGRISHIVEGYAAALIRDIEIQFQGRSRIPSEYGTPAAYG